MVDTATSTSPGMFAARIAVPITAGTACRSGRMTLGQHSCCMNRFAKSAPNAASVPRQLTSITTTRTMATGQSLPTAATSAACAIAATRPKRCAKARPNGVKNWGDGSHKTGRLGRLPACARRARILREIYRFLGIPPGEESFGLMRGRPHGPLGVRFFPHRQKTMVNSFPIAG